MTTTGRHTITANYSGDSNPAPSSASVVQAVDAVIVPTLSGWTLLLLAVLLGATLRTEAVRVRLRC